MARDRASGQDTSARWLDFAAWLTLLGLSPRNRGRAAHFGHLARVSRFIRGHRTPGSRPGRRTSAAFACLCATFACATPPDPASAGALEGSEWTLTAIEGRPPLAGTRVSLEVADTTLGGYNGCNWYGGSYEAADGRLRIGPIQSTARGCLQEGVGDQESRYHDALGRVTGYRLEADVLELTGPSGDGLLAFARREPAQVDAAELVGTAWRLAAVRDARGAAEAADTSVTLAFPEAGVVSGFAGCRDYTGTYEARGDRLFFTSFHMASLDCDRGDAATRREGELTTDLGESTYWRIVGDRLELTTHGGRRLTFVRR